MLPAFMKYPPFIVLAGSIMSVVSAIIFPENRVLFAGVAGFGFGSSLIMFVVNYKESRYEHNSR